MSVTLGEKLRQAREAKGISISEVSEQTRISSLYLESIENNDYRNLPGGIFNKGFVKSYAKYVGVDEKEALQDYVKLMSEQEIPEVQETRSYRPEVLTDDRSGSSMLPNLIFAAIILGLLTAGVLYGLRYYQNSQLPANTTANANKPANGNSAVAANTQPGNTTTGNTAIAANTVPSNTAPPPMPGAPGEIAVQIKSLTAEAAVTSWTDGKMASDTILPDAPRNYSPDENIKIRYSKYQAQNLQLFINGKQITLPAAPLNPKGQGIEFEINKANVGQILESGAINLGPPVAPGTSANTAAPGAPVPAANTATNAVPR